MIGGVPVLDETEQVHVEHGEVHLQILVDLCFRHLGIAVEMTKRLIDHIEHLTTYLFLAKHLTALGMHRMQIVTLHHQFCDLLVLLGHPIFWHDEFELHIVIVLLPAA